MLGIAFLLFVALFATFLVSAVAFFVMGERLLREVRRRYPDHWSAAGDPTFVSFAIWGRNYWRPIAAGNYFTFREYRVLGDDALVRRAAVVRTWQLVMYGAAVGFVVVGWIASRFGG